METAFATTISQVSNDFSCVSFVVVFLLVLPIAGFCMLRFVARYTTQLIRLVFSCVDCGIALRCLGEHCENTYPELLGEYWTWYLMVYVCVFGLVAALALIQLIRSLLAKCDMTYWKIIHMMVFLEGLCMCARVKHSHVSRLRLRRPAPLFRDIFVIFIALTRRLSRSSNARSGIGARQEWLRDRAAVDTSHTGRSNGVLYRGSFAPCAAPCDSLASTNFVPNNSLFCVLWFGLQAIIVTILLYWCQYYTRVFSSEAHPRIQNVVQFYKVLLAVMFVFEMTMR